MLVVRRAMGFGLILLHLSTLCYRKNCTSCNSSWMIFPTFCT